MNIIGYTRVSTNEQAENGVSLKAQREKIHAYCKANDSRCVEIVEDDGYSAKDLKRPGLQRVLDELERKDRRFTAIVVTKLDRLTRSVGDLVTLTKRTDKYDVSLVSIQEAVDTGTATGKLFRTLVTCISEWERGVIGERTKEALAYKRRNGERAGAIPYGFTLGKDGKRLVPVPDEQAIVQDMRHKRELPMSYARIADELNAERIPTKQGKKWKPATVWCVLQTLRRYEANCGPHQLPGTSREPAQKTKMARKAKETTHGATKTGRHRALPNTGCKARK